MDGNIRISIDFVTNVSLTVRFYMFSSVLFCTCLFLLEQLETVNRLAETSGISVLTVVGLVVKLPAVVSPVDRADSVLRFLVSVPAHDIVRSIVVYPNRINRFPVTRIAVVVVIPVISVYFRQPSAA